MTLPNWRLRFVNGAARSQSTRAEKEEAEFLAFITNVLRPAFSAIAQRLSETGRTIGAQETRAACGITVLNGLTEEMSFRITSQSLPNAIVPLIEIKMHERKGLRIIRKSAILRNSSEISIPISETTIDNIIDSFFKYYRETQRHMA